ncbi:NAD(P)/FAD-dependent oxidoreductase [Mycobacteroides chelonae]|uniref:Pyridine nucleotide-disulfide oxidoreductase domain-containing protein 2 n=1 Tax=Mycobacteroides chelonae TaxID=1774 RepID=A0AB73TVF6_MYCCH|nr:NAD(P)/FAD-dependent oxidoreductase [Mycobacteroides chelonae]MBF9352752.1 NAD(P)/FAD-dependent oxidoreductase [Mycobacteroides chelonae]MEC4841285.1 NAD(P)/FAD-dependent oxidoreductase [Mycobacteroides chelonae]MEC4845674.1 NAD(P)/FAD-dependent oxidoreductase [Mycobacteroides chelonae]MEC4854764.1 NAD(P)/FAD-dependent oxidoreductase [Mycobacteroides chelonae]MEC4869374.1 NAD(P)/FAD-dependent oxidoreductase [Mycobacteroides chelonae]
MRVIVIGAGHNGLVAAAYLARAGNDVTVIEGTDSVGGVCQTAEVIPGFRGNLASNTPHNFDLSVIEDLELEQHGLQWIELHGPSAMVLLPDAQRIISFPDRVSSAAEFDVFGRGEADRYAATLAQINALARTLDVSFYDPPPRLSALFEKVGGSPQEDLLGRLLFGTATEVSREFLRSWQVQASLAMLAVTGNFIGPSTPGSAYQLLQRPLYRESAAARSRRKVQLFPDFARRTPRGGMGALTAAIAASAEAAGARIVRATPVARISVDVGGRATGVVSAEGREYPADAIMSAVDPVTTMLDLVPREHVGEDLRRALENTSMDGCLGKVYVALNGLPRFAAARSRVENDVMARCGFRIGGDIDAMDDAFRRGQAGDWSGDPIIYGVTQTAFDDSLNRPGRHLMSLSVSYAPRRLATGDWTAADKDRWARHVISHLSKHIPNLSMILADYRVLTPQDLETTFGIKGGNALHGDVVPARMFQWRPYVGASDYTTCVEGLFLCSTGTWPANYVSGLSGRNAAKRLLEAMAELNAAR